MMDQASPITEDWLRAAGFKWHQFERQPDKHWLLWLGEATKDRDSFTSYEDIGIELAPCWFKNYLGEDAGDVGKWFCWLRDDAAGRYHRFIHLRHLRTIADLVLLIEGITGQQWDIANNLHGSMYKPESAARIRESHQRFDRRLTLGASPYQKWSSVEKDDTRGRALPEHMEAHAKTSGEARS
jgi:hypothetical protein